MILISHRGNTNGKDPNKENEPNHILQVLKNFDCEIDVWFIDSKFYLGHDSPTYPIEASFLETPGLWCHAKNLPALEKMLETRAHCFWHQTDTVTLTSRGFVWTFPGQPIIKQSIELVFNGEAPSSIRHQGICSDYIENYQSFK